MSYSIYIKHAAVQIKKHLLFGTSYELIASPLDHFEHDGFPLGTTPHFIAPNFFRKRRQKRKTIKRANSYFREWLDRNNITEFKFKAKFTMIATQGELPSKYIWTYLPYIVFKNKEDAMSFKLNWYD